MSPQRIVASPLEGANETLLHTRADRPTRIAALARTWAMARDREDFILLAGILGLDDLLAEPRRQPA